MRPAFSVLTKTLEAFTANVPTSSYSNVAAISFPQIHEYLRQYQDPKNADAIMRVQQELDETKVVLHKTIESVLARGEKLDDLVDRSQTLSNTSKQFFKTAKKVTSCFLKKKVTCLYSFSSSKTRAVWSCRYIRHLHATSWTYTRDLWIYSSELFVCVWTDTFVHCKCTISYDSSGIAHIFHSPKPSYVCILRKIPPAGLETAHGLDRRRQAAICSVF